MDRLRIVRTRRTPRLIALTIFLALAKSAFAEINAAENLNAQPIHGQRIDLSWSPGTGGAEGYRVRRACSVGDPDGYCTLAVLDNTASGFRDFSVQAGTEYQYRVEVFAGSEVASAHASTITPSTTELPRGPSLPSNQPVYSEPQGAWRLGAAIDLSGIQQIHLIHNLESSNDLRNLLAPIEPTDPANSCRQHSLPGRLHVAGYTPSITTEPLENLPAHTAEVYFHDFTRAVVGTAPLPTALEAFDRIGDEGYVLIAERIDSVDEAERLRIVVGARSPKGLFRGGMTVQRLLVDDTLCAARETLEPVVVLDYADHGYRSAMLKTKMTANYNSVPAEDLDRLDALARSGATAVHWGSPYALQEAWSWDQTGAKAAAAFKIAAADRFMEVRHSLGSSGILFGTKRDDPAAAASLSLGQVPYADGLAVFEEPFSWTEVNPGQWTAKARRQGILQTRDSSMSQLPNESPWIPESCNENAWSHDEAEGRPGFSLGSFRLSGPAQSCGLKQTLEVSNARFPSQYFLSAWIKTSPDAVNLSGALGIDLTTSSGTVQLEQDLPADLNADEWTQVTFAIDESTVPADVTEAELTVRVLMDSGTLWIDDLTLYEWGRPTFPFGSFLDASGWSLSPGPDGFQFDSVEGRTDLHSLKMTSPMEMNGLSAHLAKRYHPLRLEPGRHMLSAWIKADHLVSTGEEPPSNSFPVYADLNLKLYAEDADLEPSGNYVRAEYLKFPRSIRSNNATWYYHTQIFDISEEEAESINSARVQIRGFQSNAPAGAYWIDDIQVRRLDGDLRNLLGGLQPPIVHSASGAIYEEGIDYEVCQVGATETQCSPPLNYTEPLEGGLTSSYDEDRPPFEIRWLGATPPPDHQMKISYDIGAQYSQVATPTVNWDGTITTKGQLNFCDVDGVIEGIELDNVFGRLMGNYTLQNFAPNGGEDYVLNAELVNWSVSEVLGMNRSLACRDDEGEPTLSNAARFAHLVNKAVEMARIRAESLLLPDFRFVLWADMFDPFNNGGDINYQLRFGGVPGRSACAFAPQQLGEFCAEEIEEVAAGEFTPIIQNADLIMEPWSYNPNQIRRMAALSSWYEALQVRSHVLPADQPVNIDDWAGIAHRFESIEGVDATYFRVSNQSSTEIGTLLSLQAFWNHDWKLLYLHDNETPASSFYQIPWGFTPNLSLENATADTTAACATMTEKFEGNNDGGLCLASTGTPQVLLSGVPIQGGRSYRIGLLGQRRPDLLSAAQTAAVAPPSITVQWSNGEWTEPLLAERIYDTTTTRNSDGFDRYQVQVDAPNDSTEMNIEIDFGASGSIVAADDIMIFESLPSCFDNCALNLYLEDSDGDGLTNGWEIDYGLNPYVAGEEGLDADLDGLNNLQEQQLNGNPYQADTDGDGATDSEEAAAGTALDDASSFPTPVEVPALSTWALATLAGLLGITAIRRRAPSKDSAPNRIRHHD